VTFKGEIESTFLRDIFSWVVPIFIFVGIWYFMMRRMAGQQQGFMSLGKNKAKIYVQEEIDVRFADVAGVDESKQELVEVIEFLKQPEKFTRLGGQIPRGILLVGPPGTGKTMLAKAVAGESGVPFFSLSGSEFVEMFVGLGAARVRDLFVQAKQKAPCIIFIDELDALGKARGVGMTGGHDEREQTLNQLLVEMDGFESNEGVILISATNRPDVLDPALLRPGRFDRQVVVSMPDIRGREKILRVHMKKTPIGPDVETEILARGTPGFSGADLENLVNEAALIAAKQNKDHLEMADFEEAKDKVYLGLERKSKVLSEEDKKTTAYHEGGHALVARLLPGTDAVNKITIIPRGRAAGVTWFLPEERDFKYKDQLESELSVAFGGRAAEEIVFGRISTGASNDIKQATDLAQKMIRSWGMSEALGPLSYEVGEEQIFLGREIAQHRDYSEQTAQRIDAEISQLIAGAYSHAKTILTENLDILHRLAAMLVEKETVMGRELDELIHEMRPGIVLPNPRAEKPGTDPRDAPEVGRSAKEADGPAPSQGPDAPPQGTDEPQSEEDDPS
jgi:cell division protease FtsH